LCKFNAKTQLLYSFIVKKENMKQKDASKQSEAAVKLDKLDKKIILALERDGTAHNRKIARAVRSSPEVVRYRIARLEREGVIACHMALVNVSEIGFVAHGVYCRIKSTASDKDRSKWFDVLMGHPRIQWVSEFGGRFDIAFSLQAKNSYEFYSSLNDLKAQLGDYLEGWDTAIRMFLIQYPRDYLLTDVRHHADEPYWGKELHQQIIDSIDFKLLKAYSQNARIEISELAKKVGMPASTAAFRLKRLRERKIIQGVAPNIYCQKYGYQCYQIFLTIDNLDEKKRDQISRYAKANANVIFFLETMGKWNFEFIIEVRDPRELQNMANALRTAFPWISSMETAIIFHNDVKYDLFPYSSEKDL
jgi:DNA-binding Lrp family transcriptional regulator